MTQPNPGLSQANVARCLGAPADRQVIDLFLQPVTTFIP